MAAFGRLAVVAPAINLVVVPLVAPVMAAGIVAMGAGLLVGAGLPAGLGAAIALPAWVGLRLMIALVDLAAGLPFASLEVPVPWSAVVALGTAALIVVILLPRRSRVRRPPTAPSVTRPAASRRPAPARAAGPTGGRAPVERASPRLQRAAVLTLVVAIACAGAVAASRPAGVARLTVLDVGQGDAILVEGARGGRLLVDGGPDPDRLLVELDRRICPRGTAASTWSSCRHPHEDHVAGLALLLDSISRRARARAGDARPGTGLRGCSRASLATAGAPVHGSIAAGDRLAVDDVALEVRWPIRGAVPLEPPDGGTGINNVSVVLLGTVGDRRFLLTGDVEEDVDPSLLAAGLPPSTSSRWPITAAGPRRRTRCWTRSCHASRSPQRVVTTRTAIPPRRRWTVSPRPARASTEPTSTAR